MKAICNHLMVKAKIMIAIQSIWPNEFCKCLCCKQILL